MRGNKALPYVLAIIFFGCMLAFVFEVKFPIGCEPSKLKFIAKFFHQCDY